MYFHYGKSTLLKFYLFYIGGVGGGSERLIAGIVS